MAAPLSQIGLNELFPMIKALEKAGADEDFVRWAKKEENACELVKLYLSQAVVAGEILETTVPDLPADKLLILAQKKLNLTRLHWKYDKYDFIRDERGKTYEVMVWQTGRDLDPAQDVRSYFLERGFLGNPAVFIAWLTKYNPTLGFYATIPEDDRLFRDTDGVPCVPCFIRLEGNRELELYDFARFKLSANCCYVAFREVPAPR